MINPVVHERFECNCGEIRDDWTAPCPNPNCTE